MSQVQIQIAREIETYLKTLLEKHHHHMPIDELFKAFELCERKYAIEIRYIESLDIEEDREDKRIEYRTESFKYTIPMISSLSLKWLYTLRDTTLIYRSKKSRMK